MPARWKEQRIKRFFGLDLKTNVVDVADGYSLDAKNCFQNNDGDISKFRGSFISFDYDGDGTDAVDEIGSGIINGTKYFFFFRDGDFFYTTSLSSALTAISPAPSISTVNQIWWAIAEDRLFFVDGTNVLRFFDGSAIYDSVVYGRPTVAPTGAGGAGYDYSYTVTKGFTSGYFSSESAQSPEIMNIGATATITVPGATGPQTLAVNDKIRVYGGATGAFANKNVTPTSGAHANGTYGTDELGGYLILTSTAASYAIVTVAITDDQPQLYTELGVAVNKTAPTGFTGLVTHYGRLVAWKDDTVYNAKIDEPHSWPDDNAQKEAFRYTVGIGDTEDVQRCISFQEALYVFKKTQIFIFGGIGPDNTGNGAYGFRRLEANGNGCSAPKSVVVVGEETKNYLVYRGKNGFFATNGSEPIRVGEKIEPEVQSESDAVQATSVAFHHKKDGLYFCFTGSSSARVAYVLDVRVDNGQVVGWFKREGINVKCAHWDESEALYIWGDYTGFCAYEKSSGTGSDYSDVGVEFLAPAAFNTATDEITVANSYQTGDSVVLRTTGTIPGGIIVDLPYSVIRISATVIKLSGVDITTTGTGTHSLVQTNKAIDAYYTTNWFNGKEPAAIKKFGRLGLTMNVDSSPGGSNVNTSVSVAYDWVDSFADTQTVTVTAGTATGTTKNIAFARRKARSIRFKFANSVAAQNIKLLGVDFMFEILRNRGSLV